MDSDLSVECLISTGVVTALVKGPASTMCAVYSVIMGIGKAEDGSAARIVRRACKSMACRQAYTSRVNEPGVRGVDMNQGRYLPV